MLLETICFESGHYPLLCWHQKRVSKAFASLFSTAQTPHDLRQLLPPLEGNSKRKVRFLYDEKTWEIAVHEHLPRQINNVQCVYDDHISYSHKYQDRSALAHLYALRKEADEILIIKKGLITDAFYYNPVFWDGDHWYVPKSHLLAGTRRQYLLDTGKVKERNISLEDLSSFEQLSLVNALVDLEECIINIANIQL